MHCEDMKHMSKRWILMWHKINIKYQNMLAKYVRFQMIQNMIFFIIISKRFC